MTLLPDKKYGNELPLQEVKIKGEVSGLVGEFSVTQVYKNWGKRDLEVIYTFPLPDNAVVTGFAAYIGETKIVSDIREQEEAFQVYDEAVRKGDTAFLVEQYRPNIFQISLGQVQPNDNITVTLNYIQEISFVDQEMRITVPNVVAPRYIPFAPATGRRGMGTSAPNERVPDADFITPPIGEVDYTIQFTLTVDPPKPLEEVTSPSHGLITQEVEGERTEICLDDAKCALDRDIVILCKCAEENAAKAIIHQKDGSEGYLLVNFIPELDGQQDETGKDYVFLIDISGSMSGAKLEQAKDALNLCLRNLSDLDTFNIIAFDHGYRCFSPRGSVPFNQDTLENAAIWISELHSMGGTEIFEPLKYAISNNAGEGSNILLLTDGQVGNEEEILAYVKKYLGQSTIFTFGIDTAVNEYFINELAQIAGGKPEFIYPNERIEDKVLRQFARINSPIVDDVEIDWGGLSVTDFYPKQLPRLFDMEPLLVVAKYKGQLTGDLSIKGNANGEKYQTTVNLSEVSRAVDNSYLEKFWAARKIKSFEDALLNINPRRENALKREIIELSLKYGVGSSLTSFVAVHQRENKAKGLPETMVVPVATPAGWGMFEDSESFEPAQLMPDNLNFDCCTGVVSNCLSTAVSERAMSHFKSEDQDVFGDEPDSLDDMLRKLALNQRADGSFINHEDDGDLEKMKVTAMAVIALIMSSNRRLYKKQLTKAIKCLVKYAEEPWDRKEIAFVTTYALTLFALKKVAAEGVSNMTISDTINNKVREVRIDALSKLLSADERDYISGSDQRGNWLASDTIALIKKLGVTAHESDETTTGLAWRYINTYEKTEPCA